MPVPNQVPRFRQTRPPCEITKRTHRLANFAPEITKRTHQSVYGFGATGMAGFPNFAVSIATFPSTPLSSVVDCPLVQVTVQ